MNATIFPYPLYTSIVYGCSIPHRHSDATQMDKMCVQFLYARRTFQIVADKEMGLQTHHLYLREKNTLEQIEVVIILVLYPKRFLVFFVNFYMDGYVFSEA